MPKLPSRQALRAFHNPFHSPLHCNPHQTRHLHSELAPFSGLPSYSTLCWAEHWHLQGSHSSSFTRLVALLAKSSIELLAASTASLALPPASAAKAESLA